MSYFTPRNELDTKIKEQKRYRENLAHSSSASAANQNHALLGVGCSGQSSWAGAEIGNLYVRQNTPNEEFDVLQPLKT